MLEGEVISKKIYKITHAQTITYAHAHTHKTRGFKDRVSNVGSQVSK